MFRKFYPFGLSVVVAGLLAVQESTAITLRDAFESARNNRLTLKERQVDEDIASSQQSLALSQILPTFSVTSSHTLRDQIGGNETTSAFGQRYQHNATLTVDQPIFQGGAEYYGLRIASTGRKIAELQRHQAELELYREVARSFYSWLTLQAEVVNLKEQEELLQKRADLLSAWVKIGRSKETDLIATMSESARIVAELSKQQSELQVIQRQLEWITGLERIENLNDNLSVERLVVPAEWRAGLEETPVVRASELTFENTKRQIGATRANYWPTASLQGNYYLDRAGILARSKWDATLNLRWEFFSGGETLAESSIRAKEALKQEMRVNDLKRQLKQDFEGQHQRIEYQKHTVAKLETAVKLAWKSYIQQQKEFQTGLLNHLDVLRALDTHLLVKRSLDREKLATKLAWIELSVMAGRQP